MYIRWRGTVLTIHPSKKTMKTKMPVRLNQTNIGHVVYIGIINIAGFQRRSYDMSDIKTKRKMTVALLVVAVTTVVIGTGSLEGVKAQMTTSNMTGNQNQTMMGANITGSIPFGPTIAKAIASQIHISLANASTTAEKAVGANAHSAAVRIGEVHGFLVYMALVLDSNNNFHGVLVDPGTGKVLASTPVPFAALGMMMGGGGMPGPGMMGPGMSGYGAGMMQHGMMKGPGIMMGHP